jgi:hypothetical protein
MYVTHLNSEAKSGFWGSDRNLIKIWLRFSSKQAIKDSDEGEF